MRAAGVRPILGTSFLAALIATVACGGGGGPSTPASAKGSGTKQMAKRLEEITRGLDPSKNVFLNGMRAAALKAGIEKTPAQKMVLQPVLADELLKAGRTEEAIAAAEELLHVSPQDAVEAPPPLDTHKFLGLAYMRLAEQENCVAHHGIDSCLLPIKGTGVHTLTRGSRSAIRELTAVLEARPDDLGSRWLLNIATMTLGEYPDKVPAKWRIPPKVFTSEYDIKRFYDVAPRLGLAIQGHAGGAVMDDFDGDGFLDVMFSSMGVTDQMRYFRNNGDGTFSERTEAAGLLGETGGLNLIQADYDNDGDTDVLVLRGGWMKAGGRYPASLLRNNGDGTFEDVTEAAGILRLRPTQTGAWGDYDNDGWLDLIIGNESLPEDPNPSDLFHNNRDGTFSNSTIELGNADFGYVKGVVWGDFNNDGRQDLYISILGRDNLLLRNDGKRAESGPHGETWTFTNVAAGAGVGGPLDSFSTWFWDFDNDGFEDLYVAGYRITDLGDVAAMHLGLPTRTEMPRLYRNNRDGTFSDVTHAMRLDRLALPMGSNFGDLDNDGWPDAYIGDGEPALGALIPNRLFRNAEGRAFQDVTLSADVGNLQKGHGVAFGDLDNDGDQDILEEMGGWFESDMAPSVLFENPGHGNHWITLRLEGRRSNRSALGARIKVRVTTPSGPRDIYTTCGTGGSFGGNSLQQEIGLGTASKIEAIEVRWPAGQTQTYGDVAMDRIYRIVEGETAPAPVEQRVVHF
ncbi:MAG TPA: CRTAC1 family protein [Candidatus Polarisedimenticolia bacterium]|nr:CRTAC1 family protein [Candidatus Polarisedimenticolia bacterium]